ncbi:MAG: GGDEF domain-containing protein [Pseudomonadota bacterium]
MLLPKTKLVWRQPENSAGHFFFFIVFLGLLSIGLIIFLATYGLQRTISRQIYIDAEDDAVHISQAIMRLEAASFLKESAPDIWQVQIDKADLKAFDMRMRHFLKLFKIAKIKIYDDHHTVIYSTDLSIIGMSDTDNNRLKMALNGLSNSTLKRKESMVDLSMEEIFDVDVVETYVPISIKQGKVIGSFEIYKDITRYRDTIASLIRENIGILAMVLLLVFTPSMLIVRSLTRRLTLIQAKLQKQASVDSLTGVLCRREILAQAHGRIFCLHRRRNDPSPEGTDGLIMLDIDHFKRINDTYGHLVGDLVLTELAQRLITALRQDDIVGRYGGEEFLVVLPESSLETTRSLGERLRRTVADNPFACEGHHLSVTISVGISCFERSDAQGFTLALAEADKALYLAKNAGRNQVRSCQEAEKNETGQ